MLNSGVPISHAELTARVNQSEKDISKVIYETYWRELFAHAVKMTKNKELASDIVQDVIVSFLEQSENPRFTSVRTYLYKSVKNGVINLVRKGECAAGHLNHLRVVADQSYTDIDYDIQLPRHIRLLESSIQDLPPKMKEIFILSYNYYLTNKEIAERLNKKEDNIERQLFNAIGRLRAILSQIMSVIVMYLIMLFSKF
jgi:RNA polymerase sigma-70 factor (ECF subfamily)